MRHWLDAADLYEAAGHTHVPISIKELRMATKSIGKASVKAGKVKMTDTTPHHFRIAKDAKAKRLAKAWTKARKAKA